MTLGFFFGIDRRHIAKQTQCVYYMIIGGVGGVPIQAKGARCCVLRQRVAN
jgi:hypothetical protein